MELTLREACLSANRASKNMNLGIAGKLVILYKANRAANTAYRHRLKMQLNNKYKKIAGENGESEKGENILKLYI